MPKNVDDKKTLKVSGVSQLLRDQITKEFQRKENSTGYREDVDKLHVCPNDKDYVLVEFVLNVPGSGIGDTLKIGGTQLKVEHWNSRTASTEDFESVSKIWPTDWPPLPDNDEMFRHHGKMEKKDPRKEARNKKFDQSRPGLNPDKETTSETPFNETKVKLNNDFAKKVQKETKCQEILKESKVKLDKSGYLTGTWNAIYAVGGKLASYFPGSGETGNENEQASKQLDETFNVNSLFLRYILAYHYEVFQKLENDSQEISFAVKSKSERDLKIIARDGVDDTQFSKTVNDFIDFYQATHQKMHQEVIPVSSQIKKSVISEARLKFPVVIDSTTESDKITIYGEKEKVQEAKGFLISKVHVLNTGSGSSKPATTKGPKGAPIEKLSCDLPKNVKLVVYQGDLTKEEVDAIVNPANERLDHGGGAALAIVKAGGRSIQEKSNDIMKARNYRHLQPGEVEVTDGGKLPCKFIVHAVGPIWYDHHPNTAMELLYTAVYNSLHFACRNGATSISIPAISSGVYKAPVDVCARVLFDAVINFVNVPNCSIPLKEIHFVNIDYPTYRTFSQEMEKRFGHSMKREKVEAVLAKDTKEQGTEFQTAFWKSNPGSFKNSAGDPLKNQPTKGSRDHTSHDDHKNPGRNPSGNQSPTTLFSYSEATAGKKTDPKPGTGDKTSKDDECSICLCEFTKKKTLDKCGHSFCTECIHKAFKTKKQCPICSKVYGSLIGDQPDGQMFDSYQSTRLSGYGSCGTIVISYRFRSGTQGPNHPNPGKPYQGTSRTAYLPDNREGRKVLRLLKKAFDQKLTFTIGRSTTTGMEDVVTWNDIHHKTSTMGGPTCFGYPDPKYLKRVQEELAAKGITE